MKTTRPIRRDLSGFRILTSSCIEACWLRTTSEASGLKFGASANFWRHGTATSGLGFGVLHPAQAADEGSAPRAAPAHARDRAHAGALWLPAGAHPAQARRLDRWSPCRLSALPRGRIGFAQQAAAAAQDGVVQREGRCQPERPNQAWSLDFVHDELSTGQKFRALTVVDVFTREGLAIEVGQRLRGENVVEVLNRLVRQRGAPQFLFADNGAEFTGQLVDLWPYHHGTRIDFSRPGKPTDNAYIETFNGSLRDECLNLHWFETIAEAKRLIEAWRREYNESRPHMALGNETPQEYALRISPSPLVKDSVAGQN